MRKWLWVVLVLFMVSPALALDQNVNKGAIPLKDLEKSLVEVWCVGTGVGLYPGNVTGPDGKVSTVPMYGNGRYAQMGSGWVTDNPRVIITAAHVVTPAAIRMVVSDTTIFIGPAVYITERSIYVGRYNEDKAKRKLSVAKIFYVDNETDVAVIILTKEDVPEVPDYIKPYPVPMLATVQIYESPMGYYEEDLIHYGDQIATVVRERLANEDMGPGYVVRTGKIVSNGAHLPDGLPDKLISWFNLNDITSDIHIIPGDSGSLVIGFLGGKPYIIGIARAMCTNGETTFAYITRVDFIVILAQSIVGPVLPMDEGVKKDRKVIDGTKKEKGHPTRPIRY